MNSYSFLRDRKFTFYECINFARFYVDNRDVKPPHELMLDFLKIKRTVETTDVAMKIIQIIESAVVNFYDLSMDDVRGKRRFSELVRARQIIAFLSVKYASQHLVARSLPGTNRNNIQYSKTQCAIHMEVEPDLATEVEHISNTVAGQIARLTDQTSPEVNDEPAADQTPEIDSNL